MKKYPKLRYPNHEDAEGLLDNPEHRVVVQEKLDGANFRFTVDDDGAILWGTRNTMQPKEIEESNKAFRHAVRYLYRTIDFEALEQDGISDSLVFYGESMHKHSLDYDAWEGKHPELGSDMPNVIIFDVWCDADKRWLGHTEMEEVCAAVGLETAPVLFEGTVDGLPLDELKAAESAYRTPQKDADNDFDLRGLAEGVVIKNQDADVMAKLVHPQFKEKNAIAFNDPKKAKREGAGDGAVFVASYVTDARIAKHAHKLIDQGHYGSICMEMMERLPKAVLRDVMEEEGWDIICNEIDLTVEAKEYIRKQTCKKCVRWLKAELQAI